jgi:hypothetical protein
MLRHPFYSLLCVATCFFLYRANERGFTFLGKAFATTFGRSAGRPGLYHK